MHPLDTGAHLSDPSQNRGTTSPFDSPTAVRDIWNQVEDPGSFGELFAPEAVGSNLARAKSREVASIAASTVPAFKPGKTLSDAVGDGAA